MRNVPSKIEKIITVANDLASTGMTNGSTMEVIAAAFVLERIEFLPYGYNVVKAWDRLGDWQEIVRTTKAYYGDMLVPW